MGTFAFVLFVFAVLALYAFSSLNGKEIVKAVEAGPLDDCDPAVVRHKPFRARPINVYGPNGTPLDMKNMSRVVVCGSCMVPRNIPDNSVLLVEKIDVKKPLEDQIKQNDIVMIHIKEQNIDKIRVFEKFDEFNQLVTYRYSNNGSQVMSTKPHSRESVVGVVRYKL